MIDDAKFYLGAIEMNNDSENLYIESIYVQER